MKIINFEKKKMMLLANGQQESMKKNKNLLHLQRKVQT